MGKWIVQYWDEGTSSFIDLQAVWDQTNEELDGDCYATFYLANSAENRALIQQDLLVAVWFDDTLVFSGTLTGGELSSKRIKAVIYDTVMLVLDEAEPVSGVYDQKPATAIAADLLAGTGLSLGYCPSTLVSVVFYNANRLDCFKFLADALNLDLYSVSGIYVNLATKGDGVVWTPSSISVSTRGLDRSKQRTKIIVRGIDCWGNHILGVAGAGTKVKTFSSNTVTDEATLNGIAAKKLSDLNTDSSGAPVSVLITVGKGYLVGDSVTVTNDQYLLNGTYRIKQLNKTRTQVKLQLDKFRKTIDRTIEDLRSWEDQGIYLPGSTSWSLNLQGLIVLLHLNEGTGTKATNRAPVDKPLDGTIVSGSWQQGPVTMMLSLAGDGYVDMGDPSGAGDTDHPNGLTFAGGNFSVGAWFSPSASDATKRYIAHKDGQFALSYKSNTGILTFEFTDSGGVVRTFNSDPGVVVVGGRLFVMVTYDKTLVDGKNLKFYLNGNVLKSFSQTGDIHSSVNKVYLGMFEKGIYAEAMLWTRTLVGQEVAELYFFPLFRVVGKGGSSSNPSSGPDFELAPTPNIGVLAVPHIWGVPVPVMTEWVKVNPNVDGLGNKTIHETLIEGVKVNPDVDGNHNKTIHDTLVESVKVNPDVDGAGNKTIHESMTETVTVTKAPTNWYACIIVFPNERSGDVNPLGSQTIASGTGLTVTATEDLLNFFGFFNWIVDGVITPGTMNLLSNSNTLTVAAKPAGTTHQIQAWFGYGWSLTSSVLSGPGSIDKVGTDVIPPGQNSTVYTATPTPNPGDPPHPNLFEGWYLDGIKVSSSSTCVISTQTFGTNHTLKAHFTNWWGVG